jgi:hypothetical protein
VCGPFAAWGDKGEAEYPWNLAGRYRCSLYGRKEKRQRSGKEHMSHLRQAIRQRYAHVFSRVECIVIYYCDYDCMVVKCYFLKISHWQSVLAFHLNFSLQTVFGYFVFVSRTV